CLLTMLLMGPVLKMGSSLINDVYAEGEETGASSDSSSSEYTEEQKNAAKAWLSAHGYAPTRAGAAQAYQDYLDGKLDNDPDVRKYKGLDADTVSSDAEADGLGQTSNNTSNGTSNNTSATNSVGASDEVSGASKSDGVNFDAGESDNSEGQVVAMLDNDGLAGVDDLDDEMAGISDALEYYEEDLILPDVSESQDVYLVYVGDEGTEEGQSSDKNVFYVIVALSAIMILISIILLLKKKPDKLTDDLSSEKSNLDNDNS
nr:hypothetical protein [Eubacterium sp.]